MKFGHFKLKREFEKADVPIEHYNGFSGIFQRDHVICIEDINKQIPKYEYAINHVEIMLPVIPKKVIGVGLNYKRHAEELKMEIPDEPVIFLKPTSAIIPHNHPIFIPDDAEQVDYEAELGVIIKKEGHYIPEKMVDDFILGYVPFNDVTARDIQHRERLWARAKGYDTFAPFGPYIETEVNTPDHLRIQSFLNGEMKQDSNTGDMIFSIPKLVSFISKIMTLYPGDIIATGTPEGIGPMVHGDAVTIWIEGMEDLINPVL